jgi:TolB protein
MIKLRLFLPLLAVLVSVLAVMANDNEAVRVEKGSGAITRNPTATYRGVTGGERELSDTVQRFLQACGWFDLKSGGQVDYNITGELSDGKLALQIRSTETQIGFAVRTNYSGPTHNREVAKKLVDGILNRLFKVQICESKIAFCADNGPGIRNIFVCDIDGGNIQQVTRYQTLCVEPSWAPDGKSLIYSMYGPSYIDVVQTQLEPLRNRRVVSYPGLNSSASISPNGKFLALIMSLDRQVDLYIKELESEKRLRLTNSYSVEASPGWNADGTSLCYVSDQNGSPKLFKMDIASRQVTALHTEGSEAVSPEWNAEDVIVYSTRMGNYTLAILNMGHTSPARSGILIRVGGDWESPSWAPDNRHIVCSRKINGRSTLYLVDSWTGNFRQIMNFRFNQSTPAWSRLIK